jgi:hypothetical protein
MAIVFERRGDSPSAMEIAPGAPPMTRTESRSAPVESPMAGPSSVVSRGPAPRTLTPFR